jgi:biopolymer transport protein ExbB/TolQ
LAILTVNLLIGGALVNYDAWCITGNIPPPLVAVIAGLFLAEPALVVAVVLWVLGACGMHFPLMR